MREIYMRRAMAPNKRPVRPPETVILLAAFPVEEALAPLAVLLPDLLGEEVPLPEEEAVLEEPVPEADADAEAEAEPEPVAEAEAPLALALALAPEAVELEGEVAVVPVKEAEVVAEPAFTMLNWPV